MAQDIRAGDLVRLPLNIAGDGRVVRWSATYLVTSVEPTGVGALCSNGFRWFLPFASQGSAGWGPARYDPPTRTR
jgi:hypothetical protein